MARIFVVDTGTNGVSEDGVNNASTLIGRIAPALSDVAPTVDGEIGENRNYGAGLGPHDEDDQVDALVTEARERSLLDGVDDVATVASSPGAVSYPDGRRADLRLRNGDRTEFCEAKLFRFQRSTGDVSPKAFGKVFNPYDSGSLVTDVGKLVDSGVDAEKSFLGIFYRPVTGPGTEITADEIAQSFAHLLDRWTEYSLDVDVVAPFDGLQHETHQRGALLTWSV